MAGLVIGFRDAQPPFDKIDIDTSGSYSFARFLLKGVEYIDHFPEPHCVNGAIRVAVMILDDFKDARTLTFPMASRRGAYRRIARLREPRPSRLSLALESLKSHFSTSRSSRPASLQTIVLKTSEYIAKRVQYHERPISRRLDQAGLAARTVTAKTSHPRTAPRPPPPPPWPARRGACGPCSPGGPRNCGSRSRRSARRRQACRGSSRGT